ncbi:MAG TPA: hypothetical protein VFE44_06250 [Thermoanaerobaculia bacterium]|nr:hypothetical protein [Thermoanaerobaculia bacterium]
MAEPQASGAAAAPRVTGLSCPSCAGALDARPGVRNLRCPFCGKTLLALGELGAERLVVEPRVDAERARERVRGWLGAGMRKDPALRREASLAEAFLCFLPFFRVQAEAIGIALGVEKRTRGSGKNRRTEYVDVERRIERRLDRTFPAVNVAEWGVARVDLAGDRLVPHEAEALQRQGMVAPPTASEQEILLDALAAFREEADPARGLHETRFRHLATLRERLSVVHYPLWVVRYHFRGRSYQALVDAEDGQLAYGKAPGNDRYRAAIATLSLALAGLAGSTILRLGFRGDDGFGALAFAAFVTVALVAWGWRVFRHGAVVIDGTGAGGRKGKLPKIAAPLPGALSEALAEAVGSAGPDQVAELRGELRRIMGRRR